MNSKNIIVVGASAGGFEALKQLIGGLPKDFPGSLFVVWHMSPDVRGILPMVLGRLDSLPAAHAFDWEEIGDGRIFVAPPDRHMLIENGHVRVTRGPKENRFRPAIDPLFRSAAYHYGSDVIGIILSGALDDGTSGLWTIKNRGGIAIVQDPNEAEVPSMPENAIREVAVDYTASVAEMPQLLVALLNAKQKQKHNSESDARTNLDARQLKTEIGIAAEGSALEAGIMDFGELTPYTCPECHGVLSQVRDGSISRFRCHTGHGFTSDSLLATVTENIENSLWSAIRGIEESMILLNHIGDHFAEVNQPKLASLYFRKANEAQQRKHLLRATVFSHEQLSADSLRQESSVTDDGNGSVEMEREAAAASDG